MKLPDHLKYTKDHEWIATTDGTALVGVTAYAVEQLGDIVHVELPEEGESFEAGDSFGTIESTKTVSDLYMPVSGTIKKVNDQVADNPEILQSDAYDEGWLVEVQVGAGKEELLSAKEYEAFIAEQE